MYSTALMLSCMKVMCDVDEADPPLKRVFPSWKGFPKGTWNTIFFLKLKRNILKMCHMIILNLCINSQSSTNVVEGRMDVIGKYYSYVQLLLVMVSRTQGSFYTYLPLKLLLG